MVLKIFKAVWFLSLLVILADFLYIYASLPENVIIHEGEKNMVLSRETLFYSSLALFSFINVLVFIISRLHPEEHSDFLSWFYGQIITLNIFFIIALNFINLYNSSEKFDYNSIGYVIYGSLVLIAVWAIGWPFYWVYRKLLSKQPV
jgi:hypothetical protein